MWVHWQGAMLWAFSRTPELDGYKHLTSQQVACTGTACLIY